MRTLVRPHAVTAASLVCLLVAFGCTDQVTTIPGEGTGGGGASTGTGGSGGADACAAYHDADASLGAITLHFRNESDLVVYLPTNCGIPSFRFGPEGGPSDNEAYVFGGGCLQTCEMHQTEEPFACGACQQTVIEILPGGSYDYVWDGFVLRSGGMEEACWYGGNDLGNCAQIFAAAPGTYRASAEGFGECDLGGQPCECQGSQCVGDGTGSVAYSDPVQVSFPTATEMDVVFGACAFGCPQGG